MRLFLLILLSMLLVQSAEAQAMWRNFFTTNQNPIVWSAKCVATYGAVGDGITDNTIAFSNANAAALSAKVWMYIPSGVYSISNLSATCAGWIGDGTNSIVAFNTNCTGAAITSSGGASLKDFSVWGKSTFYYNSSTNVQGNRVGVLHDPLGETIISGLNIYGFSKAALEVAGSVTTDRTILTSVSYNWLHDSYAGFTNRAGAAEYCQVNNNRIWLCFNGISVNSANIKVSENIITDSYNGAYWGTASDLRGHCTWIGNTFNHLTGLALNCVSNNTGGTFIGNSMFVPGTGIQVSNCRGLTFTGNQFQGTSLQVDSAPNHLSKSILFYCNQYIISDGGMIDYSGQLLHWGNYNSTTGVMVDGTGNPYFAPGGFGILTNLSFAVRGDAGASGTISATNGVIINSNSWVNVPTLANGQNWYTSSNGVPHVIWKNSAGTLSTNRLVP